jgi:hypothetical protein
MQNAIQQWTDSMSFRQKQCEQWWCTLASYFDILPHYTFRIDNAKRRLGCTNYKTQTVTLSNHFIVNPKVTETHVLNILLHEIAHVLQPGEKHGPKWIQQARAIGCDGRRICMEHVFINVPKFLLCCCCRAYPRHRISKTFIRKSCAKCGQGFYKTLNKQKWTRSQPLKQPLNEAPKKRKKLCKTV